MTISARNQLKGKIESIKEGAVNAAVTLKTESGEKITSTISLEAVKELKLEAGKDATAIIKATEVLIGLGELQISARNKLVGEVVNINEGPVNAIVTLKTKNGGNISSTISLAAVKELGLAQGIKATAIIKATSVMIAI
ncbi:TOBE domain-containing protein [Anaerovorax odorimutans]|uniref:TOBE domain-containing protein n=1 Tax=Anaerovorax odorimutans TaxID=109327 RepID=UPI00041E56D9|nr:TOBE domain-containing protein [Anaerovorax odorimutans]